MSQTLSLAKTSSQNLILAKTSFLDFCHLNEPKYALRIADYDDSHLKKQEAVKTRQIYGGMVSIASGAAGAVITHGTTLVVCAIGARRIFVACRKLKLIKEQLEERGIDRRPFMNRDWMIPVAAGLIGAGIGFGIDFGLAGLIPGIVVPGGGSGSSLSASFVPGSGGSGVGGAVHHVLNALPAPDPSVFTNAMVLHPTALQEASAFANHPGIAFHDFGQGIAAQLHAVFGHSHELIAPPSDGTLSGALGFVSGLHAAQTVEHSVAALLGSESLKWMSERLDADSLIPRMTHNMGCKRLAFSLALLCSSCDIPIDKGVFYHCCDCGGDDEFNLCAGCHEKSPRCESPKHSLKMLQSAVPGDIYHPKRAQALKLAMSSSSNLPCTACGNQITQGWYYRAELSSPV